MLLAHLKGTFLWNYGWWKVLSVYRVHMSFQRTPLFKLKCLLQIHVWFLKHENVLFLRGNRIFVKECFCSRLIFFRAIFFNCSLRLNLVFLTYWNVTNKSNRDEHLHLKTRIFLSSSIRPNQAENHVVVWVTANCK